MQCIVIEAFNVFNNFDEKHLNEANGITTGSKQAVKVDRTVKRCDLLPTILNQLRKPRSKIIITTRFHQYDSFC